MCRAPFPSSCKCLHDTSKISLLTGPSMLLSADGRGQAEGQMGGQYQIRRQAKRRVSFSFRLCASNGMRP